MDKKQLQQLDRQPGYYWGTEPNDLARRVLEVVDAPTGRALIDLGAGEGRDSVFLAEAGFRVLAVDVAPAGLEKALKLAAERGVALNTLESDVNDVRLSAPFDVLYSIGTLQYIRPERRARQFAHFKAQTRPGGRHALFAFVAHPEVAPAPDWGRNEFLYERGELKGHYADWAIEAHELTIFDCDSSGVSHRHAAEVLIAAACR